MAAPIQSTEITLFPKGISSFGIPIVGASDIVTTGNVFFVDSTAAGKGDDTSHGRGPTTPFATIDFAIGQCGANQGDYILVLPGHTETITSAAAINCDVAGVTIRFLSDGRSRGKVTLATSTAASIDVNAANVAIQNFVVDATGVDAITAAINIKAADCTLVGGEVILATASGQCVLGVACNASATRAHIVKNFFHGTADGGCQAAISVSGASDGVEIAGNRIIGNFSVGGMTLDTTTATGIFVHHNDIVALGTGGRAMDANATGVSHLFAYNTATGTDPTNLWAAAAVPSIENWGYDSDATAGTVSAVPLPIVGSQLGLNSSGSALQSIYDLIVGADISYNRVGYIAVAADFTSVTWNTVGTHEILTITGACRIRIVPIVVTTTTSGGAGTISLGLETAGTSLISATAVAVLLTGDTWLTATPAFSYARTSVIDIVVSGGQDIGFAIASNAFTGGAITFHCFFEPLSLGSGVVAGAGGSL